MNFVLAVSRSNMSHREAKYGAENANSKSFCIDAILKRGGRPSGEYGGQMDPECSPKEQLSPSDDRRSVRSHSTASSPDVDENASLEGRASFLPRPGFLTPPFGQGTGIPGQPGSLSGVPSGFPMLAGHSLLSYGAHPATIAAHAVAAAASGTGFPTVLSSGSAFHPATLGIEHMNNSQSGLHPALRPSHAQGQLPLEWFARAGMFYPRFPDFQG